jgi:hypothetical protein
VDLHESGTTGKALKRPSTAIDFLFFIFDLEYLIRDQSSEPLYAKMNPTSCCLDHGLHVLKPQSYALNRALKMRERHQLLFGFGS